MGGWQESPWREFARTAALGGMTSAEVAEGLKATAALIAGKGNDMGEFLTQEQAFKAMFEKITRPGAGGLVEWLERETDFFTAPASTKHHGAHPGGLLEHSLNVRRRLREIAYRNITGSWGDPGVDETVTLLGLLHDVCKVNCYIPEATRRENPDTGVWEDYQGYAFRDPLPLGHGEKSLFLIQRHMELTDEEALAIRWHMGAYDDAVRGGSRAMNAAMEKCRWVWWLQEADMCATYNDEREAAE